MAKETLDLDKDLLADRTTGRGHGTDALGPSDRSDSGSDMTGVTDFDSDTDSAGTGERASVEMDMDIAGEDIDTDHVETMATVPTQQRKKMPAAGKTGEKSSQPAQGRPAGKPQKSDNPVTGDKLGHLV
jgi:hypothetical protein